MNLELAPEEAMRKIMSLHDRLPPLYRKISMDTGATILVVRLMLSGVSPEQTREIIERRLHEYHKRDLGLE